jgi:hypothetical protein
LVGRRAGVITSAADEQQQRSCAFELAPTKAHTAQAMDILQSERSSTQAWLDFEKWVPAGASVSVSDYEAAVRAALRVTVHNNNGKQGNTAAAASATCLLGWREVTCSPTALELPRIPLGMVIMMQISYCLACEFQTFC